MSIRIEIGANSTQVNTAQTTANTAKDLAIEAKGIATTAGQNAQSAISSTSALERDITSMQGVIDNIDERTAGIDVDELERKIAAAKTIGENADAAAEAADSKAAAAAAAAAAAQESATAAGNDAARALQEISEIGSGSGLSPEDREAVDLVKTLDTTYGLTSIVEQVDQLGNTYVSIDRLEQHPEDFDLATETSLQDMHDTLDDRINQIETQGVSDEQIQNAIENWEDPPIAMKADVDDSIRIGVTDAKNSIMQEVGDMVEGAREEAADEIDFNQIAIPTVEEENSSNESFNELMSKLQEKPIRRADVLKKVIDEDAFYWYVMPVIDQRIYRDTVVNDIIIEAGWQKAVKERYWYHKQDKDIRDHYIYLFRSDINQMVAKATEENTASNNKPQLMPLSGNPRQLRKKNELPSGLPVLGAGKKTIAESGRKINQTVKIAQQKKTLGVNTIPVSKKLKPSTVKPSPVLPDWAEQGKQITILDPTNLIINGSIGPIPAVGKRKIMPYISPAEWAKKQQNEQDKRDLANGNYPSDFYYIACYAECDDSSMYEKRWYSLQDAVSGDIYAYKGKSSDKLLSKRDNGTYYYLEETSGSGEETEYKEVTVTLDNRAEFYVTTDENNDVVTVMWNINDDRKTADGGINWPQLQRRSFADVSRDIKVHMLPIYLLGSTIIAIDSDDVDNDGKFNYVTIDSMISPALPSSYSTPEADAPKAKKITVNANNEIELEDSTHKSDGIHTDGRYNYICRDNIRMGNSGLPCVYGQGYTWLPIDAKGDADDDGGLGIHCTYKQQEMWVADGVYSHYNGLIPSGYTKETLKNLTTMYKYKIVEKFIIGSWDKNNDGTINTSWINKNYPTQDDGRIDQNQQAGTPTYPNTVNIFVEDYSEDNIADLNEEIFDVNIEDEYISYTIKEGMIVQDGSDGGATVSNFIYDTLSYLTEKGKVNTNNIFLICVEDDGDEYIFDEYIWEKGKALKLNEQKRIKYSEDLRKVEYVQANNLPLSNPAAKRIGHEGTFEGQTIHAYNGALVGGVDSQGQPLKTKDEQADLIIRYLSILTQKDTGATIKNPSYIPSVEGNFIWNVITNEAGEGYTSTSDQMYSNSSVTDYFACISLGGVISNIAAVIKQYIIQLVTNKKDTGDLKNAFSYYFGNDEYAIGIMDDYSSHISDSDYVWHTYIRPNISNPTGSYVDSTYAAGDSEGDAKEDYNNYYNSEYDYPDYYTRDDYFKIKMEILRQTYVQMYESDPLSVIPTIIDTIFGEVGDIEDPGYDPNYYTNNLSGLLIGLYKKMTDIGNGSKDNGAKDESAEIQYEGGMPAQAEPGEEGEEQDPEDVRASLNWIIQNYHDEKLYLIEFLILNKILGIMFSSKMEYQYDFNYDFETEEFLKTFEECLLKIIEDLNNLLKSYSISDAVKEGFEKFVEIKQAFKTVFEEGGYKEDYDGKFDEEKYGILTGFDICITAETLSIYNDYIPSQGGSEYIPVTTDVWIPITTTGGDYLQKYNKILAFLIDKQSVGSGSNGYEWTYSLWRYMPSSKQYATVGTVSTISVNEPDLNSKDLESEVGSANNTDTHSEISNAIRVAREDIIQRFDKLLTEEGILSKLPKLNAILEQNFLTKEVGGQRIYTLKNAVTTADLDVAFRKQHDIETSMSTLVSAMNSGKRASFVNGVMTKSQENIYEIEQKGSEISIGIVDSSLPTPSASETVITPTPTGDPVQNNAASKSSGRYFVDNTGGSATARRRIFI